MNMMTPTNVGIRKGELSVISAGVSVGRSTFRPAAPSKTFIKVSRSLELSRSPVDGNWRAWAPTPRPEVSYEPHEMDEVASAWMVVASAPKAAAAIASAKSLGFH